MNQQVLQVFLFWVIAILTGGCAIAVVVTQNIVRSATWLLFALAGVAGIFFLLGADFVATTQILVYVGGTLVLVVFGVMLTAQGPFISMKTGASEWAIALVVGLLLYGTLAASILNRGTWEVAGRDSDKEPNPATSSTSVVLGESLLGIEKATPPGNVTGAHFRARAEAEAAGPGNKIKPLGQGGRKQVSYLLPFEIVSVHLLVVLIGAAYLARAKRRRGERA